MDIKQLILETYKDKPRHFTQILKRHPGVIDYIKDNVPSDIVLFMEQLFYVINGDQRLCKYGKQMKLKSFEGYSFCGKAGVCQCAKESVSKSVGLAKSNYSDEIKLEINNKRKATTLLKYGVENNGQTLYSRNQHELYYQDIDNVEKIVNQIKNTKLERYGISTYNNRIKSKKTCLEKFGVENTFLITKDNTKPGLDILRNKEKLSELYPRLPVTEIALKLDLWEGTVYRYLNYHGFREPYKSTFEQEITYYLNSLGIINIQSNKRTIIGKELDIYLPDFNLAIEYNGVYWHHDKIPHITKTYHYEKFKLCEEKGIELFTIFSDSWESKKDIWKEKLKAKLKFSEKKVFARKTEIVKLRSIETKDILSKHHVQGYCPAQYCYGLMYENELTAVMTFSKKRVGIGKDRGDNVYELVRYVTTCNVVGGASKLLKSFIRDFSPSGIISYSDNQYSVGNLYRVLGFELEKTNTAGYRYYDTIEKKMYHRYKFAKHKLIEDGFDPLKTEFEIMNDREFLRIWDCGSKTWIMNCT